jgi:hypothetical protein
MRFESQLARDTGGHEPGEQDARSSADYYSDFPAPHSCRGRHAETRYRAGVRFEGGPQETQARCVSDETQARNQLQKEWTQFGSGAKKQCNEESTTDNIVSYVELLTCLQMERDVKNSPR